MALGLPLPESLALPEVHTLVEAEGEAQPEALPQGDARDEAVVLREGEALGEAQPE